MSATPSNTPINTVEALEAQMAALVQQVQATHTEKTRLEAEAEEKRLEEERLREEEKLKEVEETWRRLAAAKSSSGPSVSNVVVSRWVFCLMYFGLCWAPAWRPSL
jgi:regulator of replication initiation timing